MFIALDAFPGLYRESCTRRVQLSRRIYYESTNYKHRAPMECSHDKTGLEVYFYPKGDDKSQVVVQHSKLPDAKVAAKMKTYWGKALDRLRQSLEP
jgi:hypothetical protein